MPSKSIIYPSGGIISTVNPARQAFDSVSVLNSEHDFGQGAKFENRGRGLRGERRHLRRPLARKTPASVGSRGAFDPYSVRRKNIVSGNGKKSPGIKGYGPV